MILSIFFDDFLMFLCYKGVGNLKKEKAVPQMTIEELTRLVWKYYYEANDKKNSKTQRSKGKKVGLLKTSVDYRVEELDHDEASVIKQLKG